MINFLVWIIAGAVIGWLASIIMRTNRRQGTIIDIVVGILGASLGGYLLSPIFNAGTINQGDFSLPALLVSLGGAVILLAITKLFRNIGGFLVILLIALIAFTYYSCWIVASTSAYCTSVRGLPFLQ